MFRQCSGFTLIELVIIIVVLAILAAVGIPSIGGMIAASKVNATKSEMLELKKAIVGSPSMVAGGTITSKGFEYDVGFAPSRLEDLVSKPGSVQVWNRITEIGWHGPYIDASDGDYITDAWGSTYAYSNVSRTIMSVNSDDTISVSF